MYTQQGVLDRESVVERYGQMVRRVAAQLVARLPANVDIDDLVQAGMIGLLDAVSRYDAGQGTQFETFAMQRVRGCGRQGFLQEALFPIIPGRLLQVDQLRALGVEQELLVVGERHPEVGRDLGLGRGAM